VCDNTGLTLATGTHGFGIFSPAILYIWGRKKRRGWSCALLAHMCLRRKDRVLHLFGEVVAGGGTYA